MPTDLRKHTFTFAGVLILAAIAVSFGFYIFSYKSSRESYFTESRRRQLGIVAEQIEGAIDARSSSLRYAVESFTESVDAADAPDPLKRLAPLNGKLWLAGLGDAECVPWPIPAALTLTPLDEVAAREANSLDYGSSTSCETPTQQRNASLRFCSSQKNRVCREGTPCSSTKLATLVSPFLGGDGFGAGAVFIAQGSTILFESGGTDLRIGSLLANAAPEAKSDAGKPTPKPEPPRSFPSATEMGRASLVRDVDLAGEEYRLYSHPLRLGKTDEVFAVGFLVKKSLFDKEVASLSFGALSYVPLLLGIALLATKLLKLRTMGARERLTAADVRMLAFSLLAMAGTMTTLGLTAYEYHRLGLALNAELAAVAVGFEQNLNLELSAARKALATFAAGYASARVEDTTQIQPVSAIFDLCTQESSVRKFRCEAPPCCGNAFPPLDVLAAMRREYPFFDMVIRNDPMGVQFEKWAAAETATSLIRVDTVSARDARLGRLRPGDPPVTLHTRISPNTGALIPVLSMPLFRSGSKEAERSLVGGAVLVAEMAALLHPVLPDGFRYAVLERDGQVIAHSNLSRSLYENFFEESDAAGNLRSLIEARAAGGFSGSYRGRAQRFFATPLKDSPWTLVVFRDREVPRTLLLDALLTWFAVYGVYLGIALLVVTMLRLLPSKQRSEWIWPAGAAADSYATCLYALLSVTLLFLAAIIHRPLSSSAMLGAAVALPLAAVAHVYLRLGWSLRGTTICAMGEPTHPRIGFGFLLIAAVIGLWLCGGDRIAREIVLGAVALLALLALKSTANLGRSRPLWLLLALLAVATALWAGCEARFVAAAFAMLIALGSGFLASAMLLALGSRFFASAMRFALGSRFLAVASKRNALADRFFATECCPEKPPLDFKQLYAAVGLAFVVVVGVLPAAAFFEDVWDESLEVFIRHGQLKTAAALDRRHARISEDYEQRMGFPSAQAGISKEVAQKRRQGLIELRDDRLRVRWDIVPSSFFGSEEARCSIPPTSPMALDDRLGRIAAHHFSGLISSELLVYHDESIELRELLDTVAGDGRWRWRRHSAEGRGTAELCWSRHELGGGTSEMALVASWPPPQLERGSAPLFLLLLLLLGVLLSGWYFLIRWLMSSVYGVGEWQISDPPIVGEPHFGNGILLLRRAGISEDWVAKKNDPSLGLVWDQDVHVLDLRSPPTGRDVRDSIPDAAKVVLVKHLEERLEDLPTLDASLEMLESLVFRPKRRRGKGYLVIIVSAAKPLAYLRRRMQSNFDVAADPFVRPEVIGRWARLLDSLDCVDADEISPAAKPANASDPAQEKVASFSLVELVAWLVAIRVEDLYRTYGKALPKPEFGKYEAETTQTPRLRGLAWEILWQRQISHWRSAEVTPEEISQLLHANPPALLARHRLASLKEDADGEQVQQTLTDATRAHYRALWSHLTDDEQLILVQLAKEGYVNPRGWRLISDLMARGLVICTPAPRLMNASFKRFVASEETDLQVKRWETADGRSAWDKTRSLILMLIIGGGLILYVTQPERLAQMVGVIGALGAAAATVANLFGLFGTGRSTPPAAKT